MRLMEQATEVAAVLTIWRDVAQHQAGGSRCVRTWGGAGSVGLCSGFIHKAQGRVQLLERGITAMHVCTRWLLSAG